MEKALFVVGASSELGTATIQMLKSDYSIIVAHYRHMNKRLEILKEEMGQQLMCVQADLSIEEQVADMLGEIKEAAIKPSHIIHFPAEPVRIRKFQKTGWNIFQKELNISVRSAVMILQALLPAMVEMGNGRIILILSMVVNGMPPKYNSDYVMTKYALLSLVKTLAVEYADKGITVNGVSPALIQTRFVENMHEYMIEQNAKMSPTGRNLTVEDVIPTIQYLLSAEAAMINGQNIYVTGGR